MAGIILVIVIVMFMFVRKYVGRPLAQFVGLLEQFERDEGDLTRRVQIASKDEIGTLGRQRLRPEFIVNALPECSKIMTL